MDVHADGFVRLLAGWIVRRARKGKRRLRSYDSAASPLTTLLAVGTCTLLPASLLSRDATNRERERERERDWTKRRKRARIRTRREKPRVVVRRLWTIIRGTRKSSSTIIGRDCLCDTRVNLFTKVKYSCFLIWLLVTRLRQILEHHSAAVVWGKETSERET